MVVRIEEVRELQLQVKQLTERLDFLAPMLSLLNFTHDYVQKVECEASVQILRLKHARLKEVAGAVEDGQEPVSVDTAKWLHMITDLVISLKTPEPNVEGFPAAKKEPCTATALKRPEPDLSRNGEVKHVSSATGPSHHAYSQGQVSADFSSIFDRKQRPPREVLPSFGLGSSVSSSPNRFGLGGSLRPARNDSLMTTVEFSGLSLGKGTWANAYRQATGLRRDALRLLCTSGIVTERELADDLTVISEDHIEECVSIALEMLQHWPRGDPPQAEAKSFFQERLEALYMRRAPSPLGPH